MFVYIRLHMLKDINKDNAFPRHQENAIHTYKHACAATNDDNKFVYPTVVIHLPIEPYIHLMSVNCIIKILIKEHTHIQVLLRVYKHTYICIWWHALSILYKTYSVWPSFLCPGAFEWMRFFFSLSFNNRHLCVFFQHMYSV